jgi:hypothetical protein
MVSLPVSAATDASPPIDGAQQPPPVCSPNIPATAFTAEALFERGLSMLTGEGERPAASGGLRKALAATLELLLAVCVAAERLWAEHEEAIRRCCGPSMPNGLIDGREVFAYLLNDVFGFAAARGRRARRRSARRQRRREGEAADRRPEDDEGGA